MTNSTNSHSFFQYLSTQQDINLSASDIQFLKQKYSDYRVKSMAEPNLAVLNCWSNTIDRFYGLKPTAMQMLEAYRAYEEQKISNEGEEAWLDYRATFFIDSESYSFRKSMDTYDREALMHYLRA